MGSELVGRKFVRVLKSAALVPVAAVVIGLAAPAAGADTLPELDTVVSKPVYSLPKMPAPVLLAVEPTARAAVPLTVSRPEVLPEAPFAPAPAVAPAVPSSGATFAPTVAGTTFTRPATTTRRSAARVAPRRSMATARRAPGRPAPVVAVVTAPTRTLVKNVTVTSPPVDPRPVYAQIALARLLTSIF